MIMIDTIPLRQSRLGHELGQGDILFVADHVCELLPLLVAFSDLGDEGVLEKLADRPSLLQIFLQAPGYEIAVVL